MRYYSKQLIEHNSLDRVVCDKCGATSDDDAFITDEWMYVSNIGGDSSPFGDMQKYHIDLCPACFFEMVKDFVRYECKPVYGEEGEDDAE